MKTIDDGAPPDPASEELLGVSLRRYACVYAGLSEGFELEAVLENEGIDARGWPAVDRAWTTRIADDHEAEARTAHPFDVLLAEGQAEYARPIPPLDEEPRAFFDFMRIWPDDPEPLAMLERLGVRPSDVVRLQRAWSARMSSDPVLRKQIQEILMADAGPLPEIAPAPARLPPREHVKKKPTVPSLADPAPEDAPPEVPGLSVPLPGARARRDEAPAQVPLAPPSSPVGAVTDAPSRSPWDELPELNETVTTVGPSRSAKLPFEGGAPPERDAAAGPVSLAGLPFGPQGAPPPAVPTPPKPALGQTSTKVVSPFALEALPPGALGQTSIGAVSPFAGEVLPFGAPEPMLDEDEELSQTVAIRLPASSRSAPPRPPEPSADAERTTIAESPLLHESPLPFARPPSRNAPAPPPSAPAGEPRDVKPRDVKPRDVKPRDVNAPAGEPRDVDARFAAWSLEQYAALCAELAVFASDTETTFGKYGLPAPADRAALDALFRKRLAADPATYADWQALYWRYRNHWGANPRR